MTRGIQSATGTECNKVAVGGITELFGDPNRKPEKPYTIILFPGGSVEISRCSNGSYWVHVATHQELATDALASISEARIDAEGRYCDEINEALSDEIARGDIKHIAFLIGAKP